MCKPETHKLCEPEQHQKVCARRTRVSKGGKNKMHDALKNQSFQNKVHTTECKREKDVHK
eukprot:13518316-Ditylum_brightwellii.AAC.1